MAIAFKSISNTTYGAKVDDVVTAPDGIVNGDTLIGVIFTLNATEAVDPTPPSGFTQIGTTIDVFDGASNGELRVYWKVASSESGDYTFSHASASSQGIVVVYAGGHLTAPIPGGSAVSVNSQNSGVADTTANTITTPSNNCMVVIVAFDWADTAVNLTPPTGTTPTFIERLDVTLTQVFDGILATAGATGNKTWANNAATTSPWGALMFAIAPDVTVPDAPTAVTPTHGGYNATEVAWTVPYKGSDPITDYAIDYALASAPTSWLGPFSHTASALPVQYVTGLGTTDDYVFRVAAINSVGQGAWSSTSGSLAATDTRGQRLRMDGTNVLTMASDLVLLMAGDSPPSGSLVPQSFFFAS